MPSTSSRLLLICSAFAALLATTPVAAQWAWRDAAGGMVFSDKAPPPTVPEKSIVRRPDPAAEVRYSTPAQPDAADAPKPAAAAAPSPVAKANAPKTLAEREIESRRRQQEQAEAQKKAAEEEQRKLQMAENCERLRSYQRALDDGLRLARVNAAGAREVLDDAARAAETERTRAQIAQFCR